MLLRHCFCLLLSLVGSGFFALPAMAEGAPPPTRIADSSTGDQVAEASGWKRYLLGRRGSGMPGGGFFYLQAVDGVSQAENALEASVRASRAASTGRDMLFRQVEHPLAAGRHRLRLVGQYAYAAPVDSLFRAASNYRVEGEIEVELRPDVTYRVRGVLEEYRQEVWLEEAGSGRRVGDKLLNKTVAEARERAMAGAGHACCNLHFQDETISDENPWGPAFIPAGTPIALREYGRNSIRVLVDGRPMTIELDAGRKLESREQLFARLVVAEDPTPLIEASEPAVRQAIRAGKLRSGMSRQQVLLAIGYPRRDLTPALEARVWKYPSADDGDFEVLWGEDGRLAGLRAEEAQAVAKILEP